MKMTIVKVLIVLVFCAVGFGFYRGWFALSSPTDGTKSNKVNINLSLDGDKVKEDAETVKGLGGKVKEEATEPGDHARDKVKSE